MEIKLHKGCIMAFINNIGNNFTSSIPSEYIKKQQERDKNKYHVTVINSTELKEIDYKNEIIDDELFILGLGRVEKDNNDVYYLVVHCNYFNKIRSLYKLKKKNYHITLGFKFIDIHNVNKDLNSIIEKNNKLDLSKIHKINDIEVLRFIESQYNYIDDKLKILELKQNSTRQNIDYLISKNNYLGYIFSYNITKDIEDLIKAVEIYDYDINIKYDRKNIGTNNMIKVLNNEIMKNNLDHRKKMYLYSEEERKIIIYEMPRNFSWVIPNKIGGISKISRKNDLLVLKALGVKKIYYFLEKRYFDNIDSCGIEINYIHCLNTKSPTYENMLNVLEEETFEEPILFGCLGGFGRTGTALSCYLCYNGIDGNRMSSENAIHYLKSIRPKSIESDDQMNFIRQFSTNLYKSNKKASKIKTSIKFIMLVGLPGAGKTTFCDLFMTNGMNIQVVTQDTMGRNMCEQSLLKFIKEADIVILDRTNYTIKDRQKWLELTQLNSKNCLCIYLNTPKFICINRAKNRKNHPTIKEGSGERIINDIESKLECPTKEEGFSNVIYLEDQEDVREYLKTWKCEKISIEETSELHIHKFPRTAHLFNIGGATVDDRYVSNDEYNYFLNNEVHITEKVDGAQMGISIDENYKIMVQNRSHYVNSKSASQFKPLDKWVYDHRDDLYEVLDNDHILFGEWLYAKHSISYNNLPDYFLAFDLYNKREKVFYNRNILEEKLQNTNIKMVRVMYEGKIDKNKLLKMIEEKSDYADYRVEGVYLKVFDSNYVKYRCKLVRNDFIAGNEHWSKKIIEQNKIVN